MFSRPQRPDSVILDRLDQVHTRLDSIDSHLTRIDKPKPRLRPILIVLLVLVLASEGYLLSSALSVSQNDQQAVTAANSAQQDATDSLVQAEIFTQEGDPKEAQKAVENAISSEHLAVVPQYVVDGQNESTIDITTSTIVLAVLGGILLTLFLEWTRHVPTLWSRRSRARGR
jgi:hypothetical protein